EKNPLEQSHLGIFLSKEIFKGGVIRIHNAFVHDESEGQSLHASRSSRLCAQAQSIDDIPFHSGPIESGVKHLLGSVIRAMVSPSGSIMASLKNVNGFLAVYTPSDDLIRIYFKQKGVVPKVMLHIFEEFVLSLGRHSLNNEIPRMTTPMAKSLASHISSKDKSQSGAIKIRASVNFILSI
nr:hypothetical protein [Tanacetum cinerariifolium]